MCDLRFESQQPGCFICHEPRNMRWLTCDRCAARIHRERIEDDTTDAERDRADGHGRGTERGSY